MLPLVTNIMREFTYGILYKEKWTATATSINKNQSDAHWAKTGTRKSPKRVAYGSPGGTRLQININHQS